MNSPQSLRLRAYPLEALKNELCAIRKSADGHRCRNVFKQASALEQYLYGDLGVIIEDLSPAPDTSQYHLFVHRVPYELRQDHPGIWPTISCRHHEVVESHGCNNWHTDKPDGVLVIYHLGDFPNKVIAAGKAWSCRIWLLPPNLLNEDVREDGVLVSLPLAEGRAQASGAVGPRVVFFETMEPELLSRREKRLVKRVFEVNKCVPEIVPDLIRQWLDLNYLSDFIASFRIVLSHVDKGIGMCVDSERFPPPIKALPCPIDVILRRLEGVHDA